MLLLVLRRSYEGTLDGDMSGAGDMYYWAGGAPLAQGERGSMASLDSTLRKGPANTAWRQPELPEVIAMLNYRLDPVKSNAAAYLQHLTFKNDKVSTHLHRTLVTICRVAPPRSDSSPSAGVWRGWRSHSWCSTQVPCAWSSLPIFAGEVRCKTTEGDPRPRVHAG